MDTSGTPRSSGQRGRVSNAEGGARGGVVSARRRSTLASAADDDYPTAAIKHRGNRRRIDPIVSINHIFEEIYKVRLMSLCRPPLICLSCASA